MSGIQDFKVPLVLPCPVIKSNLNPNQQHLNPGRITNGSDPSGMKVLIPYQLKNQGQLKCLLRAKRI